MDRAESPVPSFVPADLHKERYNKFSCRNEIDFGISFRIYAKFFGEGTIS